MTVVEGGVTLELLDSSDGPLSLKHLHRTAVKGKCCWLALGEHAAECQPHSYTYVLRELRAFQLWTHASIRT